MREILWKTPIQLSKLYQFQLNSSDLPKAIPWDEVEGRHKMRGFFADPKWHEKIDNIHFATGAQGGVVFLRGKKPAPSRPALSYVVKAVDAPERVLFAEFVLRQVANAKVPKSLVVNLNWDVLGDKYTTQLKNFDRAQFNTKLESLDHDGKLLSLIFCNDLQTPELKTSQFKQNELLKLRGRLLKDSKQRANYLIVMKSLTAGERAFDPFGEVVDPFASPQLDVTYSYGADAGFDLVDWLKSKKLESDSVTLDQTDRANYLPIVFPEYRTDKELLRSITRILITKQIFSNQELMIKAGRILAADTLLGNSDRFEGTENNVANIGNAFFFNKKYRDRRKVGKADNPVGVIDDDAFFPSLEKFNNNIDDYLKFILEDGWSDLDPNVARFRISQLKNVFEHFEQRILFVLLRSLFFPSSTAESKLRDELWEDDGTFFGHRGKYKRFTNLLRIATKNNITFDKAIQQYPDANWNQTVAWIKQGFIAGIKDLLAFSGYRSVWGHLVGLYGMNGTQSDYTAFLVRHRYMRCVDTTGNSFQFRVNNVSVDHKAVVTEIKNWLQQRTKPIPAIAEALTFGTDNSLIDEREAAYIRQFVEQLDRTEQQEIVTKYTSSSIREGKSKQALKDRIMAINLAFVKVFSAHMEKYTDLQIARAKDQAIRKNTGILDYLKTCDLSKSTHPAPDSDAEIALSDLLINIPDTPPKSPDSQRTKFKSFIMIKRT